MEPSRKGVSLRPCDQVREPTEETHQQGQRRITNPPPAQPVRGNPQIDLFGRLEHLLEQHFYKPDIQAIRIILGTAQAHYLPLGEPPWLFHVAPPGTGKTTAGIMGACDLPNIITMGDVTENAFLSGFFGVKEPGILEKSGKTTAADGVYLTVGDMIILIKDFTTVLAMRREKRGAVLSQFREMYDGEFKRAFGTGETKVWRGRITVIAAVTPVLDRHYSIFSTLGERFLQVRSNRPDSPVAGEWAIRQQGQEMLIRRDLRGAVNTLFEGANSHDHSH